MQHETILTVRFGETDLLGHVNNRHYFTYLEEARVDFVKQLQPAQRLQSWPLILASIQCDFLAQAYFDQTIKIVTSVSHIGNKSFGLTQPMYDQETGKPIANGESTLVYFDFAEQKSKPIPQDMRDRLSAYLDPKNRRSEGK